MRSSLAAGVICLGILLQSPLCAYGMQFQSIPVSSTELVIGGRGPIVPGDTTRLMQALSEVPPTGRSLVALAFDSGGGNVAEAKQMVGVISSRQLPVVIPSNSQCASACFLLFAASPRRLAAVDALVGVHSASQNGEETDTSLAVTTLMARDAAELGVPAVIVGKMVETAPGRVEWLTPADLALMSVTVYDNDLLTALHRPNPTAPKRTLSAALPQAPTSPTQAPATPTEVQPGPTSAFAAGQRDHQAWETWLASLQGQYRDGVIFAQTQMQAAQPVSCYGPNNVNRGDFTLGCNVAQRRLAPLLAKLQTNPDYAAGWNLPVPPVAATGTVEREYQGVYFCATQIAHLTLKVFQPSGGSRRRALFVFGPHDTGQNMPRGSFLVEGAIDINGGVMTLTPVKWVSQPPGYHWLGLSGRSDDGGKTFSGRIVDSSTCTRFTLERVPNTTAAN